MRLKQKINKIGLALLLSGCVTTYDNIDWVNKNNIEYNLKSVNMTEVNHGQGRRIRGLYINGPIPKESSYAKDPIIGENLYANNLILIDRNCLTDKLLDHELGHLRERVEGFDYHTKYTSDDPAKCTGKNKHIKERLNLENSYSNKQKISS